MANTTDTDRRWPAKPGYRRFWMTVANGCGDEASTLVYVPDHRSPRQCAAAAVARVRHVISNEGPFTLRAITEI